MSSFVKIQLFNKVKMNWPVAHPQELTHLASIVCIPHLSSLKTAASTPGPPTFFCDVWLCEQECRQRSSLCFGCKLEKDVRCSCLGESNGCHLKNVVHPSTESRKQWRGVLLLDNVTLSLEYLAARGFNIF